MCGCTTSEKEGEEGEEEKEEEEAEEAEEGAEGAEAEEEAPQKGNAVAQSECGGTNAGQTSSHGRVQTP